MILPREAVYQAWGFTLTLAHQGPLWQVILETPLGTLGAFWEARFRMWGEWSWAYDGEVADAALAPYNTLVPNTRHVLGIPLRR